MVIQDEFLSKFLSTKLQSKDFKVFPLAGDASNRRYYRIIYNNESHVLMQWEPFQVEKYPFLSVLNHFKKYNVHVPKVVAYSESDGLVLLEDLGDLTLERKFWEGQNQELVLPFYKMAVDELVKIHHHASANPKSDSCTAFDIQFDVEKFMWELNYGKENLLNKILNFNWNEKVEKEVNNIFADICTKLHNEPKKIAHRDYHSRNLMLKLSQMCVIDFQDARLGPIQYDLVSLLKDSYVDLSDQSANILIQYYLDSSKTYLPKNFSKEHFDRVYELQSIQRCFKACGSFASFYNQRQDRRYLKYITGTLKRVMKSLHQFPEYKAFSDVLIDSGALERKYESL